MIHAFNSVVRLFSVQNNALGRPMKKSVPIFASVLLDAKKMRRPAKLNAMDFELLVRAMTIHV